MRAKLGFATAILLGACQPTTPASPPSGAPGASVAAASYEDLAETPQAATALLADIASGETTSEKAVRAYLDRIAKVDDAGPMLNAVLAINPNAMADAKASDARRKAGKAGALEGVPILLKDNIETLDPMATTAGSLALKDNITGRDAPMVKRLRDAGAVIIGKANLSEWANFRSDYSSSGWSAVGGLTKNPHALDRNACGSSSGSGSGMAAGLAALAVGTETDGSITCPASINGIVGLKPTVGLVSRTGIVPISASQDTAGPMTLTVTDAALLLTVMAGSDPADPATKDADAHKTDYMAGLDAGALKGKRIGVLRYLTGYNPQVDAAFETALKTMTDRGAVLVDIKEFANRRAVGAAEGIILNAEFKTQIDQYLATTSPEKVKSRTLADLIAFNKAEPRELQYFGQDTFENALKAPALTDKAYLEARANAKRMAGPEGIDRMLAADKLDVLVAPSGGPAWVSDLINGDHFSGSASGLPAVAGYPHITVPMGWASDLPLGVSFIGPAWSESKLLGIAYSYEQGSHARGTPKFRLHVP